MSKKIGNYPLLMTLPGIFLALGISVGTIIPFLISHVLLIPLRLVAVAELWILPAGLWIIIASAKRTPLTANNAVAQVTKRSMFLALGLIELMSIATFYSAKLGNKGLLLGFSLAGFVLTAHLMSFIYAPREGQ